MKKGDVQESKPGKSSITVALAIWAFERPDGRITIKISGAHKFITTVNDKPDLKRYHRKLFGHFKQLLREKGRWPV
jgi:hypothetical protein